MIKEIQLLIRLLDEIIHSVELDEQENKSNKQNSNWIVFVAPPTKCNNYYKKFRKQLYDFYANVIKKVNSNSRNEYIVAIVDKYGKQQLLNRGITVSNILINNVNKMEDIWIRDFGTVQIDDRLYKFIYSPTYLKKSDARYIDKQYRNWLKYNKIKYTNIDIILDGGNFVFERNSKKLIVTDKILSDNPSFNNNKSKIIKYLKNKLNVNNIAIIPQDPMDITGHADGMVTFINDNIIGINNYKKYKEQKYLYCKIINCLNDAFGENNIFICDLPYNPTNETYKQFASAKGVYTNVLNGLYTKYASLYEHGNGYDQLNIDLLSKYCSNDVIIKCVNASDIAILGGSVRCLSCHIWGKPANDFMARCKLFLNR
eukprot:283433_1